MSNLAITDMAILVGYNPEGDCVYSAEMPLSDYWEADYIWDNNALMEKLRLERVKGFLFGDAGELLQEFEAIYDLVTGAYRSGWARHSDGTFRRDEA